MKRFYLKIHSHFSGYPSVHHEFIYAENLEAAIEKIELDEGWKFDRAELISERKSVLTKERLAELC